MAGIDPRMERACDVAAAFLAHELNLRRRLRPNFNPDELWASVTRDARISIGTPLLREGQGYYVNHCGNWTEA